MNSYLPALEQLMQEMVQVRADAYHELYGMLRYHLGWADRELRPMQLPAGKRVRPLLMLLCCEAQGGDWRQALPAAAAIELLHNFTLIHDDIEDGDRQRRGRETLWVLWGVPQALNAGDALFALAYAAFLRLSETGLPPALVLEALQRFNAAVLRITEGQFLDIGFESRSLVSVGEYLEMVSGKTAALIALSCELGGVLAQASGERVAALREFGHALGMAFQMEDDLLGLWGDPQRTGKPVGSDLRRRKKSLPILYGLEHSAELRVLWDEAPADSEAWVSSALVALERAGSRAYAQELAAMWHARAVEALARTGGTGPAQAALVELTGQLLGRTM